ncbi:MAG: hypothetical protein K0S15_1226 [Solirubrobacterales bacterium]|jgi:hypothetical protein|nr:hypothetical protein [Solirubrobacterales bacterium]
MAACTQGPVLDGWRRRRLLEAGVPPDLATEVASDPRYDLHGLLLLTDHGCDPELAVRILAPLEGESGRC